MIKFLTITLFAACLGLQAAPAPGADSGQDKEAQEWGTRGSEAAIGTDKDSGDQIMATPERPLEREQDGYNGPIIVTPEINVPGNRPGPKPPHPPRNLP